MLPVCEDMISTLPKMCSGARRSFFCRMKCKIYSVKEEADTNAGTKYTQSGNFNSLPKPFGRRIIIYLHISYGKYFIFPQYTRVFPVTLRCFSLYLHNHIIGIVII